MLEIIITDGGIKTRKYGSSQQPNWVRWPTERFIFSCNQYSYTPPTELPSCERFYNALKDEGYAGEDIIKKMIRLYIPWYCFKVGHLEDISLCIGLIGHRGACKTASAVYMMIFDWMIRGKPIYSNVDIAVIVRYRDCSIEFHSLPWQGTDMLDNLENCEGGVVFVDEINLSAADSSRHASGANLAWNNDLQQIRKRLLNVIWTAQKWSTVDDRTRWQTDYVIECRDCFHDHSYNAMCPGDKAKWDIYELSGLSGAFDLAYELEHRNLINYKIGETQMVWIRPISWWAYDTRQEQDDDYIKQYKIKKANEDYEQKSVTMTGRARTMSEIVDQIDDNYDGIFYGNDLYESLGYMGNKSMITRLGIALKKRGYKREREMSGERRIYYVRSNGNGHG